MKMTMRRIEMSWIAAFVISFMFWPSLALAQALDQPISNLGPIDDEYGAENEKCFFDLTVSSRRSFSERSLSNDWCGSIHKLFGFDRSCFTRRHDDGRWVGSFRHQRRFHGSSYDGIFRGYNQWSDRHLFRGVKFRHSIDYSPTCFGRGSNGGGGYP